MNKKLKRIICALSCLLVLSLTGNGQSHFVYFQSEDNTPFYIRFSDSLMSSNSEGYLLMHHLSKGGYAIIAGFPGKKIPEAAFRIHIGTSGNKGYLLKKVSGKLNLEDIQDKKNIPPIKTAMSAGNRVRLTDEEKAPKEDIAEKVATTKEEKLSSETKTEDKESKKEALSFSDMLNAVTGGATPEVEIEKTKSQPKEQAEKMQPAKKEEELLASTKTVSESEDLQEKKEAEVETEKSEDLTKNNPNIFSENELMEKEGTLAVNQEEESIEGKKESKGKLGVFEKLLQSQKKEKEEKPKAVMSDKDSSSFTPEETVAPVQKGELTFLDFDNLHQPEKEKTVLRSDSSNLLLENSTPLQKEDETPPVKKKRKRFSFDDLLAKIDTTSDTESKSSVAQPLLDKNRVVDKPSNCDDVADGAYFNKLKRKIAGRNSESSMLRSANRSLSSGPCLTLAQIKEIAFLFISDNYRYQFLEAAYPHCAEKGGYEALIQTLTSAKYKKRLKAAIQ